MPFVTAEDGVRIHYELEGPADGSPLVLLHGFTSNLRRWYEAGYVERLRDRFRVLLVDARGHGESDKPLRPEGYDWRSCVLDVVSAIRDAGLEQAHLWGYSMGGQIAQSAMIYAPQRFLSVTFGGASPYGTEDSTTSVPFEAFWEAVQANPGADREAWQAAFQALHNRKFGGAIQALRTTRLPYLLYAGTADAGPYRGLTEFIARHNARHFTLPGKDHLAAFYDSAVDVVPQVTAFIDEVVAASK
jgi:pimeloyl-ACP methyl ester carboxylesterase